MDQNQFRAALQKFQKRKAKQAAQSDSEDSAIQKPTASTAPPAMPFVELVPAKPKEEKPFVQAPRAKPMEVLITGPVEMTFKIDYSGHLMGGQLTKAVLEPILRKALSPLGRVT